MRVIQITLVSIVFAASVVPAFSETVTLGIANDRFTINGEPKFLLLVAYFDVMRVSDENIKKDFAELRAKGVDGLRIFPNWWNRSNTKQFPGDTLMTGDGKLRSDRLKKLKRVLDETQAHGLIVDVSFAFETVEGLSDLRQDQLGKSQGQLPVINVHIDDYERGLVEVTKELRTYRNIFIDIQNEFNGRITHLEKEQVKRLRDAIKRADADRLVTASLANEIGPEEVSEDSNELELDIVAWHESRNPWHFDTMDELTRRAKSVTTKPIYFGEPAYMDDEHGAEHFITAITNAKKGGAAAWTLHTQHGFDVAGSRLFEKLSDEEKAFLDRVKSALEGTPWGSK